MRGALLPIAIALLMLGAGVAGTTSRPPQTMSARASRRPLLASPGATKRRQSRSTQA